MIADLFIKKNLKSYFKKEYYFLLIFCVTCFISILVNFERSGLHNLSWLILTAICFFVLMKREDTDEKNIRREIRIFINIFSIVMLIAFLISLSMFVLQHHSVFRNRADFAIHLGFFQNRLYGVFASPNVGGSYAFVTIFICLLNFLINRINLFKKEKVLMISSISISIIYLSLTGSRGSLLCMFAALLILPLLLPLPILKRFKWGKHIIATLAVRIACAAISVVLFYGAFLIVQNSIRYAPSIVKSLTTQSSEEVTQTSLERIEVNRTDIDITNRRSGIWKADLNLLEHHILFGVGDSFPSDEEVSEWVNQGHITSENATMLKWSQSNTHNGYLHILTHFGVLSFAVFVAFLLYSLIKALRSGLLWGKSKLMAATVAIIVYFLANNVMETNFLMYGANFFQAIFWFFVGIMYTCCNFKKSNKIVAQEECS